MAITSEQFEKLVKTACEELPAWVQELIDETGIGIYAVDTPPPDIQEKFGPGVRGLFVGRNYSATQSNRPTTAPTRIEIYRKPIVRQFAGNPSDRRQEIRTQIKKTIVHEVAHYLGMSEAEIRNRGY